MDHGDRRSDLSIPDGPRYRRQLSGQRTRHLNRKSESQSGGVDKQRLKAKPRVRSSLARQGEERISMLRYFAATLDDKEARDWAVEEVNLLEKLNQSKSKLLRDRAALINKQKEIDLSGEPDASSKELSDLRGQLAIAALEAAELRRSAGLEDDPELLYGGLSWDEMLGQVRSHWTELGWTKESWEGSRPAPASDSKSFHELSAKEQRAATKLGYSPSSWDYR